MASVLMSRSLSTICVSTSPSKGLSWNGSIRGNGLQLRLARRIQSIPSSGMLGFSSVAFLVAASATASRAAGARAYGVRAGIPLQAEGRAKVKLKLKLPAAVPAGRSAVRPGEVSPLRHVPLEIPRPPYIGSNVKISQRTGLPRHAFETAIELKTPEQIQRMRASCALVREALEVAGGAVKPGVTTDEIDAIVHEFIVSRGAYPSPLGYVDFLKSSSTSVNDIVAHGVPDNRPLQDGDIVNIDLTVFLDGVHGDSSCMFLVGDVDPQGLELCQVAQRATLEGIKVCGPGVDFREIGKRINEVVGPGFAVHPVFRGHGIGSFFHGAPEIHPVPNDLDQGPMLPGTTFTVEPVIMEGKNTEMRLWRDGWTYQSRLNNRSAQFEHTILITKDGHDILTGPPVDYLGHWNKARGEL